jgi:hypothetical protein
LRNRAPLPIASRPTQFDYSLTPSKSLFRQKIKSVCPSAAAVVLLLRLQRQHSTAKSDAF